MVTDAGLSREDRVLVQGRVLVLGGARSGKSRYAEQLLAGAAVTYVATAPPRPGDAEWADRVALHQERRPGHWSTVETTDLAGQLAAEEPVLIECLSLWLATVMDECGAWESGELTGVRQRVDELEHAWTSRRSPAVAVSSEVGSGVVPATASGRLYRDELGRLNTAMADAADTVVLVVAGQPLTLKTSGGAR